MWDCDSEQLQQHEAAVLQALDWHTLVRASDFEKTRMQLRALHEARCPLAWSCDEHEAGVVAAAVADEAGGGTTPADSATPGSLSPLPSLRKPRTSACSPTALVRRGPRLDGSLTTSPAMGPRRKSGPGSIRASGSAEEALKRHRSDVALALAAVGGLPGVAADDAHHAGSAPMATAEPPLHYQLGGGLLGAPISLSPPRRRRCGQSVEPMNP